MPDLNPVDVERRFIGLQQHLSGNQSYRKQWLLIADFLTFIRPHFEIYDTHCEQLVEQLPVINHPLSVTGTDPNLLLSIIELLRELEACLPNTQKIDRYFKARESLQLSAAFLFTCLNDWSSADKLLFNDKSIGKKNFKSVENYFERANEVAENEPENSIEERIDRLSRWWEYVIKQHKNSIFVPVLELGLSDEKKGRLRQLSATVVGKSEGTDKFRNSYFVVGAEGVDAGLNQVVADATRRLIEETHPELDDEFFDLIFEYTIPYGIQKGRSAELASSVVAYSASLEFANRRDRFQPAKYVAATGSLESASTVGIVEETSIKSKTEAVFFSWVEYLVVPEKQKQLFVDHTLELEEQYPNRSLKIIGLHEPKAFFYDRRLSEQIQESVPKHVAKKLWQRKFSVAGVAIICSLLFLIGWISYGPLDKVPVTGEYQGESLLIKNSAGKTLETISVDRETVMRATSANFEYALDFAPIADNGTSEVIWGDIVRDDHGERIGYIYVKTLGTEDLIWEKELVYDLQFAQKPYITKTTYRPHMVEVHDFNKDGRLELLKHSNHMMYFPGILSLLNPQNGAEISRFVNSGHIQDVIVYDIDRDGMDEIIFCGINNAFDMAFLAMIEMDNLDGYSPHTSEYELADNGVANELTYVLIPQSVVGSNAKSFQHFNNAKVLTILENEQLIEVKVIDFRPSGSEENDPLFRNSYLNYYFNFDFSLTTVGTSDGYDLAANRLFDEGAIEILPNKEYFKKYTNRLQYWDGEEFVISEEYFDSN